MCDKDLFAGLKQKTSQFRAQVHILYRATHDPRVPTGIKIMVFFLLAYILSPVDIIPDFIPVLGLLDELILVPIAISLIIRSIPDSILREYETQEHQKITDRKLKITGLAIVISIWLILLMAGYLIWIYIAGD